MLREVKRLNNLNKMGKLTKNRKLSEAKIDKTKLYNLDEACSLLKDITTTKFDASIDSVSYTHLTLPTICSV